MPLLRKHERSTKRQRGQFITPASLASEIVESLPLGERVKVLEPSFGDGAFIMPLVERLTSLARSDAGSTTAARVLEQNIYGVEIDPELYGRCLQRIMGRWGPLPEEHHLVNADFFRQRFDGAFHVDPEGILSTDVRFDVIVGNPPYGGTIDATIQDELDRQLGLRNGDKIKKETYSFFIVKCLDMLRSGGTLAFLLSDTFLTIPTMRGLRRYLMSLGHARLKHLEEFSEETTYPIVLLEFIKSGPADEVVVDSVVIKREEMEATGNYSWAPANPRFFKYFRGPTLSDFVVCSSGMTIGRNDLFLRPLGSDGTIVEPYQFEFFADPITLDTEVSRARLGRIPQKRLAEIRELEKMGATKRNVRVVPRDLPVRLRVPHPDYCYYNKANSRRYFSPPTHVIYWRDDGDAVLTFKANGNWYLRGVGGKPFFKREGLTWNLVASRLIVRYLPGGFILDSGAPCAFLREGVDEDELYFILAWANTDLCSTILKSVLNHTMNIQSKDFERLPYPHWVSKTDKVRAVAIVRQIVTAAKGLGPNESNSEVRELERLFVLENHGAHSVA